MGILKVFISLVVLLALVGGVYVFGIRPEQIRADCTERALIQTGLPLTYFRRNTDGVNDAFVEQYESCLRANKYYSYTPDLVLKQWIEIMQNYFSRI